MTVGVVAAIERHLIGAAQPGDVVFLLFTGHGQQIVYDNDEALIPINAPYHYRKKGLQGENHLRDDEFGRLLDRMRRRMRTQKPPAALKCPCCPTPRRR